MVYHPPNDDEALLLGKFTDINKANTYYWRFQIRQYQTLSAVTVGIQCLVSQRESIFICNKLFHTQFDDIQQLVAKLFGNSFSSFSKILDKSNLDYVFVDRITMERCISNHSKFWSRCMSHKTLHCLNDTYLNELCINVVAFLYVQSVNIYNMSILIPLSVITFIRSMVAPFKEK